MQDFKRFGGLTFFAIIISVFYAIENIEEYLLSFIDSYFVISLLFLMFGCFMYVLDSGFFRNFAVSYRKFFKGTILRQEINEEDFQKKDHDFLYTWPLIWTGIAGTLITLTISLTFF